MNFSSLLLSIGAFFGPTAVPEAPTPQVMERDLARRFLINTSGAVHSDNNKMVIDRKNLFTKVFGFSEAHGLDPVANGSIMISHEGDNLILTPKAGNFAGKPLCCGAFKTYSIKELREMANAQMQTCPLTTAGKGTFSAILYYNLTSRCFDVEALQAAPANRDAVFQVASNFNALETIHADQDFEQQALIDYIHDHTQGPAASLSALPGLVLRRYLLHYNPTLPFNTWGQTVDNQVNFLHALPTNVLTMSRAGYAKLAPNGWLRSRPMPTAELYEQIQVGVHTDVQVTAGKELGNDQQLLIADQEQHINQVFTAAFDMANTNHQFRTEPTACSWAQSIIDAAYEGTILSAIAHGKKRVFLTMVGGGVFGNKTTWPSKAMMRMHNIIIKSGLEVVLIWRTNYRSKTISDDAKDALNQIIELAEATGGNVEFYTDPID